VVLKALQKDPEHRYGECSQMADALRSPAASTPALREAAKTADNSRARKNLLALTVTLAAGMAYPTYGWFAPPADTGTQDQLQDQTPGLLSLRKNYVLLDKQLMKREETLSRSQKDIRQLEPQIDRLQKTDSAEPVASARVNDPHVDLAANEVIVKGYAANAGMDDKRCNESERHICPGSKDGNRPTSNDRHRRGTQVGLLPQLWPEGQAALPHRQ
jgi:hypothetical protein